MKCECQRETQREREDQYFVRKGEKRSGKKGDVRIRRKRIEEIQRFAGVFKNWAVSSYERSSHAGAVPVIFHSSAQEGQRCC